VARIQRALVSVSDKSGVVPFARRLAAFGVELLSTGGTARVLREAGIDVREVSEYTGFPELLDGRLKTLHPKIHGGLLARRDPAHLSQLREHGIEPIDMAVVNLYPFGQSIAGPGSGLPRAIEDIDIGGPALIRAAAKNYTHVAVVTNPDMYERVASELEQRDGDLSEATHFALGVAAFRHTARYDGAIADYLGAIEGGAALEPGRVSLDLAFCADLGAGQNPHQAATLYALAGAPEPAVCRAEAAGGPPLSFADVVCLDVGMGLAMESAGPVAAIAASGTICGAGRGATILEAWRRASQGMPEGLSASTVVLNRPVDYELAWLLAEASRPGPSGMPLVTCLAAVDFEKEALDLLLATEGLIDGTRLLRMGWLDECSIDTTRREWRALTGCMVAEERDLLGFDAQGVDRAAGAEPDEAVLADLELAALCAKHARSMAAFVVRTGGVVSCAADPVSPARAADHALRHAGVGARGAVLAVDGGPLPADAVRAAAEQGIRALLQPDGGGADEESRRAAEDGGVTLLLAHTRHMRF
jgi:phosphoribosylaminoimidazolecarboxamide formyltransferase/IMP cyclohydrolase